MKRAMNFWEAVQSPDYPCSAVERQRQFEASFQRSYRPAGILRQMRADYGHGPFTGSVSGHPGSRAYSAWRCGPFGQTGLWRGVFIAKLPVAG